jgi:prepilin-type N-terminal cleavage/methylation domain-containing protein
MTARAGHSLVELLIVLTLIGILLGIAAPHLSSLPDRSAVRSAAAELEAILAAGREAARLRSSIAAVVLDSARGSATIVVDADTVLARALRTELGVELHATRDTIRYGPSGRGYGASNATIILTRRAAADTIVVSRLGRVRD